MNAKQFALFLFMLGLLHCQRGLTQSQEKIYSIMILNFSKGMLWPGHAGTAPFVIGVFEYPPLAQELNAVALSAKIGRRKIEIHEYSNPEDIRQCDVLFIPAYKTRKIGEVLNVIGNNPTLIITNKMDYARKGAGINFLLVEGKLKYEINCEAIEKRGIKISSNVKKLGIIVN